MLIGTNDWLSQNEKEQADDDTGYLLKQNSVVEPPIPIVTIIENAIPNTKIRYGGLPKGLKGYSTFGSDECEIVINVVYTEGSRRYSLGHELGHLLRCESGPRDEKVLIEPAIKRKERLSDYYSACLLMPEALIKKYWRYWPSIETMARVFGVSKQAMIIRLKWLRIMSSNEAERLLEPYAHFTPLL